MVGQMGRASGRHGSQMGKEARRDGRDTRARGS